MTKRLCLAFVLFACLLILASGAYAQPICIGLSNGGAITSEGCANAANGVLAIADPSGAFSVTVTAVGGPPSLNEPQLDSNTISILSTGSGTLDVFVTAENEAFLTTGPITLASSYTANGTPSWPAGWTVVESTYIDPTAGVGLGEFATTDLLSSTSFTSIGGTVKGGTGTLVGDVWSETEEYQITATGAGNVNLTIDTAMVPEPASIMLFGSGLLGLVGIARRRFLK